ncbi:MAG: aminotransferase class V-fold PLP-dependent enzyme [Verrucomicrobiales bacterium]|nr:aminotransferase class V-fold PLP-dependent enzyme [Verrucomicrobiales bacterium]
MTIAELHANEALRQQEFPVTRDKIFLAHAGVCPLPHRVAEAIQKYAGLSTQGDQETLWPAFQLRHARELAARLLEAKPEEMALVGPTSLGLSLVANGLKFRKTDNILVYLDDYPSNVYPWMSLASKGVEVRFLNVRELGRIREVDVRGQVDENTRLVALASCHFIVGWRIDLPAIGEFLRSRNILFCVDGIQTVGAFPTPAESFDFLAADAHKWMLGPCAAGILFVRQAVQERLEPTALGWNNVRCPNYVAQEEMSFQAGARRYEAGTHNLLGLVGLTAAMELLLAIGLENISAELLRQRALLVSMLQEKGYTVLQAGAPDRHVSSIVTFHRAGADMLPIYERLEAAGVITSLRTDRAGQRYIRLSPHFYNTDAELRHLLEQL